MTLDTQIADQDPTAGDDAGTQDQPVTQPVTQPAGRTYTDSDMASARRSWQEDQRRREAAIRAEYAPKPTSQSPDHWSGFEPTVAQQLKAAMDAEFNARFTPIKQQQDDLAFRTEEAQVKAKYKDYEENRLAILEFAVQNGIPRVEVAYHAWRSQNKWQDPDSIGRAAIAAHLKKKTAQSVATPAVEGRGGGAISSKQKFKDRDDMDEAARALFRASDDTSS